MIFQNLPQLAVLSLLFLVISGCASTSAPPAPPTPPSAPVVAPASAPPERPEQKEEDLLPSGALPAPESQLFSQVAEDILRYLTEEEGQVSRRLLSRSRELQGWQQLEEQLAGLAAGRGPAAEWNRCREKLAGVVDRYRLVQEQLRDLQFGDFSQWPAAASALSAAQRADLELGEAGCAELYRLGERTVELGLDRFHAVAGEQLEAVVLHHARSGRSGETLQALANLRRIYPQKTISPALVAKVSIVLARAGADADALQLLASHLDAAASAEAEPAPDLARLRADLLLLADRGEEARQQYEKIAARHAAASEQRQWVTEQLRLLRGEILAGGIERELFLEILRDYLLFDGQTAPPRLAERLGRLERLYPGGVLTHRARLLAEKVENQARQWLEKQYGGAESLLAQGEQEEAIAKLEALLAGGLTPEQRVRAQELLIAAREAKEREEEQRRQLESQALAMKWEEANRLFGLRRFDEAIAAFSGLLQSEYGQEARRLLQAAAVEAATEIRREAAGIFVRARRSTDPRQGQELALESWRLLQRIIEEYPDSGMAFRVQENLNSVEEYLESLEPGLVERLRQETP